MEGTMVQKQQSSGNGKITRHNTHLLHDDMGMLQDSLDVNRPQTSGTHSSEESRLIDGSPDRLEDAGSEGSIETEKQYQEDLKERVKRSFAELGLNPNESSINPRDSLEVPDNDDGILRDSIEDFDTQKEEAARSKSSQSGSGSLNEDQSNKNEYQIKQEQFAQQNNNNSGGILDGENDDDHPSGYSNHTALPVNDDLQLQTNTRNEGINENSHDDHYLELNRTRSAEKTYRVSPVNSPVQKPPPQRKVDVISPEHKSTSSQRSQFSDPTSQPKPIVKKKSRKELIETLPGGEEVRVEYISDDSGDDDEHYVDEKGSPIHFDDAAREKARQQVYKIKPRPPDTPPAGASKQSSKLRKYSLERRQTPSKQEANNTGILSIEKVPDEDLVSHGKFENTEDTLIATHDTGSTGHHDATIPNSMKHETSRDVSASSQRHGEAGRKAVDAGIYAKLQLKSHQKIKSREVSAERQSKKGKQHQPSSRHSSSSKTATKERYGSNKITPQHIQSGGKKNEMHENDKQTFEGNIHNIQVQYKRERIVEKEDSLDREVIERNRETLDNNYDSPQAYQDNIIGQQTLSSDLAYVEPGYQQNLNHQTTYRQDGEDHQPTFYGGSGQGSQYPAHPIQPAYQPVPLQQQQVQYSQDPYQGQAQQQLCYPQGSAPYQGPHQQNQMPFYGSQPHNQPEPVQYGNESHMYQSNQQNQFTLHNYNNQHQVPYNLNQQRLVTYYQQPNYQGTNQQLNHENLAFYNPHGSHVPDGSGSHPQQFYHQEPQQNQPYYQHHHHSVHGSSQQPLYRIQNVGQHYQQYGGQPMNLANEAIPPLDLTGIVEDYPQHPRISPQAHHVSNNSTRKTNIDKSKVNFIEHNKVKLRKDFPQRGYLDRYKQDLNPMKPLPSISRGNLEENYDQWPQTEPGDNYDQPWMTDPGNGRRRYMQLPRQQSDTAVRYSNTDLTSPQQSATAYPQSAPVNFQVRTSFQNSDNDERSSSPIKFASFSADHATSYARMQYNSKVISKLESSPRSSLQRPGPYPVLPNIQDTDNTDALRKSDPDGYLAMMQKAKQEPQYKKYTLKDYQKLKVDTKLGGLGPDMDSTQEKQEKAFRQREYAKQVMMKNRKAFKQSKTQGWMPPPESPQEKGPTKRELALEYSKKVPKPRLPTPPEEKHERMYGATSQENNVDTENEMRQLEQLRLRHEKEKEEVAKIKKEIRT